MSPALEIKDLCVSTANGPERKRLVRNVSLEVNPGETVCIVGESGSGKSVTSFAAMGLLPENILTVDSGQILLEGENVVCAGKKRLCQLRATTIAMVFQEPMTALNPVQSVGAQVDEVLRLHTNLSKRDREAKVLTMFEMVHLPDVKRVYRSYPHQLSGGQRQRIVIAMALILDPKVLIADEPTTALDVTTQKQILLLIKELQRKRNTAVLFITHDFGVVADIADRIVVMNKGEVVETGTRDQILSEPVDPYTRMLVSSVPSLVPRKPLPIGEQVVLKVHQLYKTYRMSAFLSKNARVVNAAKDVCLSVRKGEIVGVVGESGSGKSTVARCMVRLVEATSGEVLINGTDITKLSDRKLSAFRKHVQIIFQDPYRSLNPRHKVGDSIIEGLLNYSVSRDEAKRKAIEALKLVGMDADAMERFPHQFSGGQRQRICIARAVVMEPDLLIADEAVSALDVSVQAQVLSLLDEIRERTGVAILFITHDLRVAAKICDTIVVMQQGRIVESGPSSTVLSNPQNEYTTALIQSAPGRYWDFQSFRALPNAQMNSPEESLL